MPRKINVISKTIHVQCEGVNTEPKYLQDLEKAFPKCKIDIHQHNHTNPKLIARDMISFAKKMGGNRPDVEFWCVFDCDDRYDDVREAYRLVKEYEIEARRKELPIVRIAMCRPCIEFWGLLHFKESSKIRPVKKLCQEELHVEMNEYDHNDGAKFCVAKMLPNMGKAIERAKALVGENDAYDEYEAAKVAGMYKLVESIMKA